MIGRSLLSLGPLFLLLGCGDGIEGSGGSKPQPITTSSGTGQQAATGTGTGTSTGTASTSSTGTGGSLACTADGLNVSMVGSRTQYLLKGTVLTPTGPLDGQVLIDGNTITCVAASCEAMATGATVIDTKGIISPGLIDTHNHILFDVFDETDWAPTQTYTNHNQWPNDAKYKAMVDTKQYLNGETGGSPFDLGCELDKFGEMKALVAGTTSVQASPGGANKSCYGSLARTIDQTANGLPADKIQTATVFPTKSSADGVCANFSNGKTDAYVVHIGEGVDASAENEFPALGAISTTPNCLYAAKTTIVHGTALTDADFITMGNAGMSLAWSPRSNVFLYGAGTDFTKTTNVQQALSHGINVAVAPDWSIGGSQNMLDEMRFANQVDDARFGNMLSSQDIFDMATQNAAKALGLETVLGTIEVGKRADIAVFAGNTAAPYDAILAATPREVGAVFVDGRLLYGEACLADVGPSDATCEMLDVCGLMKAACIAETAGTPTDKLAQTFAEIQMILDDAFTQYDALNMSQWKFAPVTPLAKCQ
jgi:hypothetical protein